MIKGGAYKAGLAGLVLAAALAFSAPVSARDYHHGYGGGHHGGHSGVSLSFNYGYNPYYGGYYGYPHYYRRPVYYDYPAYYDPPPTVVYETAPQVVYAAAPTVQANQTSETYIDSAGQTCREYQATNQIGGRAQPTYGTACLQPDGSWRIVD